MAFINEKIPEADQQRINYSELKNPHGQRRLVGTPWWTVDRESNLFLIGLGGGVSREDYHVPFYFLFSIRGERIIVEAFQKRMISQDPKLAILKWEVTKLQSSGDLPFPREEIIKVLTEALDTYGNTGTEWSHLNLKAVHVDFSRLGMSYELATNSG